MKKSKKAFTLIELMVVLSIGVLLMVGVYAPYSFYSNKAKLKIAKTQIAKTIYEARNMAIYGLNESTGSLSEKHNRSIGIYFDNSITKKNKVFIYSYPYNFSGPKNDFTNLNIKLVKEIILEPGVQIDKINSQNNALFYYQAISGSGSYYYFNPTQNSFSSDELDIKISFKGGGTNLTQHILYLTKTNIVDY